MLRVLAIDTSAELTSVAVCADERVLAEDDAPSAERHAETLLPKLQICLAQAGLGLHEIDLIGVGIGPGSFTGVRVGLATAKGLGLALRKPVCGVISLEALALAVDDPAAYLVACLDAFKGELFCASYRRESGVLRNELAPFHAEPSVAWTRVQAEAAGRPITLLGAGARRYASVFEPLIAPNQLLPESYDSPRARHIASLARAQFARGEVPELAALVPLYLRDSDAQLPKVPLRL
jgi:tRNA threonylcarbamoyladenosine biosynthesis protein TsaB